MTCNQLIKENDKIIQKFEEFIKPKTENPNDDENYRYIDSFSNSLYTQINKTIIKLDIRNCSLIEKDRLFKQFEELYNLYFNVLDANTNYLEWSITELNCQKKIDYKNSFIEPDKFTSEYVLELVSKLAPINTSLSLEEQKEKPWFKVGIEFANGKVYELYDDAKGLKGKRLKDEIFGVNAPDKYRTYIDCTLNNNIKGNKQKNIFARTKAEVELKELIEYCNKNDIEICQKFKDDCFKIDIEI